MKKIYFLFLFALIALMSGLQAAEKVATFDFKALDSEYHGSSDITVDDVTFIGGGTGTASRCWSDGLRIYEGGSLTFSVPETYLITKIEFSSALETWTGSQQEVVFDGLSKATIATVAVTYEIPEQTELIAPVISGVVNGETYYGSATVSISYPELATSMIYTITKDGVAGTPETVTSAVENLVIDEAGSYKIEAAALGDGDAMEEATPVEFTILEGAEYVYTVSGAMSGEAIIETTGADGVWTLSKNLTYGGRDNGNRGYQLGSSGKPMEEFTLTLDKKYENIVSVIVNAATGGSCTLSVSVGGNAFGEEVSLTNESADYEFTGNASGNVTLNFNASEKACYLKSITIISTKKESVVCATPEFSLAEGTYNETQTLTITSSEGSTIVYSINDGEIEEAASPATITLEAEATAVTYEIVAFATMDGAEESETVTKTYTIDPDAVMPQSLTVKISEVADENEWAVSAGNEGTQYKSFTKDDFEFTIDATDANSGKYYSNSDGESWRVYDGASLTISAPASVEITGIEFVTGKWNCSGANTGSLQGKVWTATEENTSSVTFSMDGTSEILEMHISYKAIPAGVEGVEAADAAVRTNADGVVVSADGAVAEVYNAAGQLVAAEAVNGERVIALPAGFYIVRVGDATAKVVVK